MKPYNGVDICQFTYFAASKHYDYKSTTMKHGNFSMLKPALSLNICINPSYYEIGDAFILYATALLGT